jgi:glycyl-tRNA synthetase beta subunit
VLEDCLDFIAGRMFNLLIEAGNRHDVVTAVLSAQKTNPAGAKNAVAELGKWVQKENWMEILPAYSRCVRITRDKAEIYMVDASRLVDAAEKDLYQAVLDAEKIDRHPGSVDDFFKAFNGLIPVINRFFDEVLVMAEETELRKNRLGILQRIVRLANGVANFSSLEGF